MKTLFKILFFLVSFVFSAWAAYNWWLHDWELVGLLMAAVLLHEIGHFIVLLAYGLRPSMFFVPLLGAAVAAPGMKEKLNHQQMATVALAGPMVNFALTFVGFAWYLSGDPVGLKFASLNASLCWFNLIPLLIFDGGRFIRTIYASLDEQGDKVVASIVGALTILVGFGLIVAGHAGYMYLLIYFGVKLEAEKDNPSDAYSPKAMTRNTAMKMVYVYTTVMLSMMALSAFIPFWLD